MLLCGLVLKFLVFYRIFICYLDPHPPPPPLSNTSHLRLCLGNDVPKQFPNFRLPPPCIPHAYTHLVLVPSFSPFSLTLLLFSQGPPSPLTPKVVWEWRYSKFWELSDLHWLYFWLLFSDLFFFLFFFTYTGSKDNLLNEADMCGVHHWSRPCATSKQAWQLNSCWAKRNGKAKINQILRGNRFGWDTFY